MSKTKVYIDGQAGTTGLQIFDRIGAREDLELMRIDEDKRHDNEERRKFLNAADIVFLCLPDAGAREAVSLIDNPNVRVIDASTAHRTADGWTYGFPELSADQRALLRGSADPHGHRARFLPAHLLLTDRLFRRRQEDDRELRGGRQGSAPLRARHLRPDAQAQTHPGNGQSLRPRGPARFPARSRRLLQGNGDHNYAAQRPAARRSHRGRHLRETSGILRGLTLRERHALRHKQHHTLCQ